MVKTAVVALLMSEFNELRGESRQTFLEKTFGSVGCAQLQATNIKMIENCICV